MPNIPESPCRSTRSHEITSNLIQKIKEKDLPYNALAEEHREALEELDQCKLKLQAALNKNTVLEEKVKKLESTIMENQTRIEKYKQLVVTASQFEKLSYKFYKSIRCDYFYSLYLRCKSFEGFA